MPKLKPETQHLRREHILDAAEHCFARAGFHSTTMHDICREAAISPGALYVYFASKEALIAGIAERDRQEFQDRFARVAGAEDVMAALGKLGQQYMVDEPIHRSRLCVEIGIESTRNPKVGEIFRTVDDLVITNFRQFFERLIREKRIAPAVDADTLVDVFMVIGDGMFWRRAVLSSFDTERALKGVMAVMRDLLKPVDQPETPALEQSGAAR